MGNLLVLLPKVIALVPGIVSVVEKILPGEKRGPDKRGAAVGIILVVISLVEGIAHKDLVENEKFAEAVGLVIDGVVAAINAVNKPAA